MPQLLGLMWASFLTEILREVRFWAPQPSSCLGAAAIALLILLSCCVGFCCGAICASLALSARLRRALGFLFRLTSQLLEDRLIGPVQWASAREAGQRRLREYRE